jgi:hypothetical protein
VCLPAPAGGLRQVNTYLLTPWSDDILELANSMAAQARKEIESEREMRRQRRRARQEALNAATRSVALKPTAPLSGCALTWYTPFSTECSVGQNAATQNVAGGLTLAPLGRRNGRTKDGV